MAESRSLSERLAKASPGHHHVPHDFVAQNQRQRMLRAAVEVVGERGYQKATIEAIAKAARVALVTFYEQFANKEDCFLAAFDESVEAASTVLGELLDAERPWPDQLASALEIVLEMVAAEPARARLCIVESQAAGPAGLARYQAALARVGEWLSQGRALNPRGERLPEGLEVAIVGGLAWLIHQRLAGDRVDELKGLLPEMLQVTLTPYVGDVEAARAAEEAQARVAA
jgi:AcrR family transcriptional regulator